MTMVLCDNTPIFLWEESIEVKWNVMNKKRPDGILRIHDTTCIESRTSRAPMEFTHEFLYFIAGYMLDNIIL